MPGPSLFGGEGEGGASFPWSIILSLLPSFLTDLFGKSEEEQMRDKALQAQSLLKTLGMKPPYQSPYTGKADSALIQLILGRLGKMGDWGYPEGMGIDMSFLGDMSDFSRKSPSLPGRIIKRG